jgi:hypothetical protein
MTARNVATTQRADRPLSGDFDLWSAGNDKQATPAYLVTEQAVSIE